MKRLRHITGYLLTVMAVLLAYSCVKDTNEPDNSPVTAGKVEVQLYTKINGYTPPVAPPSSRIGSAQEDGIDLTPWILVFRKTSDSPLTYIFAEASQATASGSQSSVMLTPRTVECQLLILANTRPISGTVQRFSVKNNTTPVTYTAYDYTEANLNLVLGGKTLEEACALLLDNPLNNPQTSAPFTNTAAIKPVLPMSYVHTVSNISGSTKIGSATDKLKLTRSVAKVVVQNTSSRFNLLGATIVFAPKTGLLHRLPTQGMMDNSAEGMFTEYRGSPDPVLGIATASAATIGGLAGQSTCPVQPGETGYPTGNNPLYLYESSLGEETAVIIKGELEGNVYYYKLAFKDNTGVIMPIWRDYEYTFTITDVLRPGFEDFDDAKHCIVDSQGDLVSTIAITDSDSHEILYNGEYYLGVSNSTFKVYGNTPLSNLVAFSVTTNCYRSDLSGNSITVTSDTGSDIALVSPLTNGVGKIPLAPYVGSVTTTNVVINLSGTFTGGRVTLALGNIRKVINIERVARLSSAENIIAFPDGFSAQVANSTNWVTFSYDGVSGNTVGSSIVTTGGPIYMHIPRNSTGQARTDGIVYMTQTTEAKRYKFWISQSN